MSKASSSDCAIRFTSAASRLTPRLILPDRTTTACEVTLLMTASSDADSPVVPTTWTRPRWAAIATLAMVAAGTVKSRMPSACADSDHRSADSLTPLDGRPASAPASLPSSSDSGASSAPARIPPSVSAIARVSARPIRPPAPATIKRMSDMFEPSIIPRGIAGAGCPGNRSAPSAAAFQLCAVVAFLVALALRLRDFGHDGVRGRLRVRRVDDRSRGDKIIRPRGDGAAWRHNPFLIAGRAGGRPNTWRYQLHLQADDLAQIRRLFRGANKAIDAHELRLLRPDRDQVGDAKPITRGMKVVIVVGRQHGDRENFQIRPGTSLNGRFHGLRIGMDRQERGTEPSDALHAARDRITDIVQLEIDEDLLPCAHQLRHQRQSSGIGELIADLVEGDAVAEPRDHCFGGVNAWQIQSNDQAIAGCHGTALHIASLHLLRKIDQLPHHRLERFNIAGVLEPVHIVIGLIGE